MNRLLVLALGAPMILIGAAYPEKIKNIDAHPAPPLEQEAARTYPPCRPGAGDDRCIQLYERGVRAAYARWQREHGDAQASRVAMGGPMEDEDAARPRRRHYAAHRPDRCADPHHREAPRHQGPRHEPPRHPEHDGEALGM